MHTSLYTTRRLGKVREPRRGRPCRDRRVLQFERLDTRALLAADISGAVYHDLNADGVRDQSDKGLANWTVFLDLNRDSAWSAGEPSALTDADGTYFLGGLAAGAYRVAEIVRSGWSPTNPVDGFWEVTVGENESARLDFLNQGSGGTGVITGNVWRDLNRNGMQDATDTGVAGWTVYLDLSGDRVLDPDEPFEVTDGNGDYRFTGILGGGVGDPRDYDVVEVLTPGWEPSPGFAEDYTVAVIEGQTSVVHSFANSPVEISGVSGVVWNDLDGNGIRDGGEPGLGGWTVYADLNTDGLLDAAEPRTTTSISGSYSLFGLEPGTHRIAEVQQLEFKPTAPPTGYQTIVAPNSGTRSNVNFGNQERTEAAIGGIIYVDRDKDGVRDMGEEGLAGITIYIDENENGSLDTGETSTVTAADLFYTPENDEAGRYRFDKLAGGTYVIRQIVPAELSATPAAELEHTVTVGPADDRNDIDGGDQYRPGEIHGVNFEDINGNHLRDMGEPGIAGVMIFVDLDRDSVHDIGEPTTVTGLDGSYSFFNLETGAYVVRQIIPGGYAPTFPETLDGILWPGGVSHAAVGEVTPLLIQTSLGAGDTHTETVSLTLPTTGALTNLVDVFLLFDDTGSFTSNSPIVRAAFPSIIGALQTRLPGIDLGFGVGRLEEYGSFAAEDATGRPFVLNQPIIAANVPGFSASIQAALDREAPGYGGDEPETVVEALYQMVTGAGYDGDNNGSQMDSGAAGLASTQVSPGTSGDVPPFASFTADPANNVLAASGTIGGAGFREGALPIIITATDTGFAYQPKGESAVMGVDGLMLPVSQLTATSRASTPFGSGAGLQETITGLNALGALVIGLGTNDEAVVAPRQGLESFASLTGAINRTAATIANGTVDPIAPGDPFYFKIGSGGDPLVFNIADGIVAAIEGAVTAVNVNVTLRASDPRVHITSSPGIIPGLGAGETATFDVTFTGDGRPHRFDLQFVREGTNVVLGSIPVVIGTPIPGDGYEFEDCEDGEQSQDVDFGNQQLAIATSVVDRHLFYNGSFFDGMNPAANAADDAAIATDKTALLPGQIATPANYSSYSRGLNGIMVDIVGLAVAPTLENLTSQFDFRVGNSADPASWTLSPAPSAVDLRRGAGAGGSDRVTILWNENAVQNQWLQVTVLANAFTGLQSADVHYWGNAIGETGDNPTNAFVNAQDVGGARDNPRGLFNRAGIDNRWDFNRDSMVNAQDVGIARDHSTSILNALKLMTAPPEAAPAAESTVVYSSDTTPWSYSQKVDMLFALETATSNPLDPLMPPGSHDGSDSLVASPKDAWFTARPGPHSAAPALDEHLAALVQLMEELTLGGLLD